MKKFIRLTTKENKIVYINTDHIQYIEIESKSPFVKLSGGTNEDYISLLPDPNADRYLEIELLKK